MREHDRDVLFSTGPEEWQTPASIMQWLASVWHFTLDVCATKENAQCIKYFTKEDNAFSKNWSLEAGEGACYMNPPYGRGVGRWVEKAAFEGMHGAVVVCLLPSRTDTKWFHRHIVPQAEVIFLKGRLKFEKALAGAPFPSMIVVFGAVEAEAIRFGLGCKLFNGVWTK